MNCLRSPESMCHSKDHSNHIWSHFHDVFLKNATSPTSCFSHVQRLYTPLCWSILWLVHWPVGWLVGNIFTWIYLNSILAIIEVSWVIQIILGVFLKKIQWIPLLTKFLNFWTFISLKPIFFNKDITMKGDNILFFLGPLNFAK